jgi:hypothetical protein
MSKAQTRKEFERDLILKAWKDPAFKSKLISDPKGTLEKELKAIDAGFSLPKNMKVTVLEEDSENIYLVLPEHPKVSAKRAEFNDAQLESAAGGSISVVAIVGANVAGAVNVVGAANAQLAANANTEANTNALHNANVHANANA